VAGAASGHQQVSRAQPSAEAPAHWVPAYIGLGSNLGDPAARVERAVAQLADLADTRLVLLSPLYRNPPLAGMDQPDYINAVAVLLTRLAPLALLDALQGLEQAQGRRRDGERWGPRTLDLDLLVFGAYRISEPRLTVPHPGICERNFVLFPLFDVAPDLRVPGLGSVRQLRQAVDATGLIRITPA